MKLAKTLVGIIVACAIAGCAIGKRVIYEGNIGDRSVKYEKVYTAAVGYEPDYRMTITFPNNETWVITDNNMDGVIKPGDDVVLIIKDGDSIRYRGITLMTQHVMTEADSIYQSMLKEIEKELERKRNEPISNKKYLH